MFVYKRNFLQLSLEINAIFFNLLVQQKLAVLITKKLVNLARCVFQFSTQNLK